MIFVTGDCHADWQKFNTYAFPEQKEMTRDDFVIVCGDFGIWHDTNEERWWLNWLSDKPFTALFVDGNHENFDRLYNEFEVVDFHGGKAHKIRDGIYHLMRGYVFNLDGKKFFAFGGASSHDIRDGILDPDNYDGKEELYKAAKEWRKQGKSFRIKGLSWWEMEIPTLDEMKFGLKTLEENNNEVNYIITHCAPQEIASLMSHGGYKPDSVTSYLNDIMQSVKFDGWFFGHYHGNKTFYNKFHLLYEQIVRVL